MVGGASRNDLAAWARQLGGPLAIVLVLSGVFCVWDRFDRNYPELKVAGYAAALALVGYAVRTARARAPRAIALRVELAVVGLALAATLVDKVDRFSGDLGTPPSVDIGTTTIHAASTLLRSHKDPYGSQLINVRPELPPDFRGFHYGPVMLVGYAGALLYPAHGYKLTTVFYLLLSVALVGALVRERRASALESFATCLFAVTLFLLPERLWFELFTRGSNDILPVALLLAAIYLLRAGRMFEAGLLAALSCSAKLSPAAFFLALFVRRDSSRAFWKGALVGLAPMLAFLAWDPRPFVDNVLLVRLLLRHDSTSLYSVTPPELHVVFPLALLVAVGFIVVRSWRRPLELALELESGALLLDFTFLLTVAEVTFKEIHANHCVWFFPLYAVILAPRRHALWSGRVATPSHVTDGVAVE